MGKDCTTLHRTWKQYKRWEFGLKWVQQPFLFLLLIIIILLFFSLHFYLELYELCQTSGVEQAIPRLCGNSLRNTKSTRRLSTHFRGFFHRILFLQICRKCGATNPTGATNCRKRACGHSTDLRDRHGIYMKSGKKK